MNSLLWFDDAPNGREAVVASLSKDLGLNLVEMTVKDKYDDWPSLVEKCNEKSVGLLLVDQCLADNKIEPQGGAFKWGSSLVGALRVKYPCVPVIGISAAGKDIPLESRECFTDFICLEDLTQSKLRIRSIMEGFEKFRKNKKQVTYDLFRDMLAAPEDVILLDKVIPCQFFSEPINLNSSIVFKWFRDEFLHFQGVLVDESTIAAMIGVKIGSFVKNVAPLLKKHLYKGIFAGICERRYWKDNVFTELADIVKDDGSFQLSHYVDHMPKCKKSKAICPICKKPYTDVLAYEEIGTANLMRYAAHLKCSEEANVAHPAFYDPIYVLAGGV